ncbi:TPA: sigma-54-dependent Fis family transcriptional regulator [Pseudomonas putida]|jgi:transcriptional regulator of acetoin/glycerol metabolism|uniref:sigma-54-dependent Fis family transcriptional regulator n=1 Tax=unclassified Pseudomonas TaxID=196821 RepID=UPI000AD4BA02|nr:MULTISPECIES: sigma-54-dependent Fis family transcriptional regulator [unclassified Pseudomonas]QIH07417.1 sigma-54-dependent Fis family transcriptional regulator [Pseudomonas sp. BIOMIG1BAC]HCE6398833.1 sigma-54-dependent Fis family transcriptional regulator [Pseudomonas aeruginosa]
MSIGYILDQQALDDARRRLLDGDSLPLGLLPPSIASSWERSRDVGLSPWDRRLRSHSSHHELSGFDQNLAVCVKPEIDRLWGVFGGRDWTLFCVNAQGVIVYAKHAPMPDALNPLSVGKRVHEVDIGTTAPSCTLHDQRAMVIYGGQHYLKEFEQFFCVSVPLYGLRGELIGALDITGIGTRNAPAVLEQLKIAAMAVESRLYSTLEGCQIIALQFDPRLIGTPFQGLIAIDGDGIVQAANNTARNILGIQHVLKEGEDLSWGQFFENNSASVIFNSPSLMLLNDGASVYAQSLVVQDQRRKQAYSSNAMSSMGSDEGLNQQFKMAAKAFAASIPVLLLGETGTGKEVFAQALHNALSPEAPFIAINCSAIPENLIEAELFGYVEGTFTGARKGGAKGRIEEANGGTLLLDEIGDMPLALQTRLLRVLQERVITRLGSSERHPINVRIVSATHCDVNKLISERKFREDLFYRLNGLQVQMPILRQRQDIERLIQVLIEKYQGGTLHPESLSLLVQQEWPGNIRQLEQSIRLAVALAEIGNVILPEHFPGLAGASCKLETKSLKYFEKKKIQDVLDANQGNIKETARQLGIARGTIYRRLKNE